MWKKILINQFHDIIPGSSITPVFENCRIEYQALKSQAEELFVQAGHLLLQKNDQTITLINTLSFSYNRPIELPGEWANYQVINENGENLPLQKEKDKSVVQIEIPPLSSITLKKSKMNKTDGKNPNDREFVLENDLIRYEFSDRGVISRIYDKKIQKKVLVTDKKSNLFGFYEDRPVDWDAWEIDIYYEQQLLDHPGLLLRKWISSGEVRQGICQELEVKHSKITQNIYLAANSKRLDFETEVDWKEDHKMLRVSFAVNIISDTASFEIQYGHLRRNTHRNTSWDMAKFEVTGHRYADLSDRDYGVALLNNCKYGYKIHDNIIDLNLLRSPTSPDPKADRGKHQFIYSLFPHDGEMIKANVLSEAAQLNQPPALFTAMGDNHLQFPVVLDSDEIVLEVLKKAEKEDALILRFYEPYGKSAKIQLKFLLNVAEIYEVDLLENPTETLSLSDNHLSLEFDAFEIRTLKIIGR